MQAINKHLLPTVLVFSFIVFTKTGNTSYANECRDSMEKYIQPKMIRGFYTGTEGWANQEGAIDMVVNLYKNAFLTEFASKIDIIMQDPPDIESPKQEFCERETSELKSHYDTTSAVKQIAVFSRSGECLKFLLKHFCNNPASVSKLDILEALKAGPPITNITPITPVYEEIMPKKSSQFCKFNDPKGSEIDGTLTIEMDRGAMKTYYSERKEGLIKQIPGIFLQTDSGCLYPLFNKIQDNRTMKARLLEITGESFIEQVNGIRVRGILSRTNVMVDNKNVPAFVQEIVGKLD